MYVIRRRARDEAGPYADAYLHRDVAGIFWVPNSRSRARRYATRAEAAAALEVLTNYIPESYSFDCTPMGEET